MNKFISFVLAFIIALSLSPAVHAIPSELWFLGNEGMEAGGAENLDNEEFINEINIAVLLDIIKLNSNGEFLPSQRVTRGELARAALIMSGGTVAHSESHMLRQAQEAELVQAGSLSDIVTTDDVVYTCVALTGRSRYAEERGGFPLGYLIAADEKGIFKEIRLTEDKTVTRAQLAKLLHNTLLAEYEEIRRTGSGFVDVVKTGETVLERFFSMKVIEGVLTRVNDLSLYPIQRFGRKTIEIDRVEYDVDLENTNELFGHSITAYVEIDNDNKTVKYMMKKRNRNNVLTLNSDEIEKTDGNYIYYYSDGASRREAISNSVRLVYNGLAKSNAHGSNLSSYMPSSGFVICIDNNNDGDYDVMIVYDYRYYIAARAPGTSLYLSFKYEQLLQGSNYIKVDAFDSSKYFEIFRDGKPSALSEIKEWDILSVAVGSDDMGKIYVRIEASENMVSGIFEEVSVNDGAIYVTIDGTEYAVTAEYASVSGLDGSEPYSEQSRFPQIGKEIHARLTHDGKIGGIAEESALQYGYVISAHSSRKSFSDVAEIKLITADGKIEVYTADKFVTLYSQENQKGIRISGMEAVSSFIKPDNSISRMLIMFKVGQSGSITDLYLPADNTSGIPGGMDYPHTLDFYDVSATKITNLRYYFGMLKATYRVPRTMPLFIVPDINAENPSDKEFSVKHIGFYGEDYYYHNLRLYGVDKFSVAHAAVTESSFSDSVDEYVQSVIIEKATSVLLEDGMEATRIYFWEGGRLTSKEIEKGVESNPQVGWLGTKAENLKFGDVIQYSIGGTGLINNIRHIFSVSEPGTFRMMGPDGATLEADALAFQSMTVLYGQVKGIRGEMILVNCFGDGSDPTHNRALLLGNNSAYGRPIYYLVETDKNMISSVTPADVLPGDSVVMRKRWNSVMDIYIIRE